MIIRMKIRKVSMERFMATIVFAVVTVLGFTRSKNLTTNTDSLSSPDAADVTATAALADLQAGRDVFYQQLRQMS